MILHCHPPHALKRVTELLATPTGRLAHLCGSRWLGAGAARLGLVGRVTLEVVHSLMNNRDPFQGGTLAVPSPEPSDDIASCFTEVVVRSPRLICPVVGPDMGVMTAHREAAESILEDLEDLAAGPTTMEGVPFVAVTFNLVAAAIDCCTERKDDLRLRTHLLLFNLTFDEEAGVWRELDTAEIGEAWEILSGKYTVTCFWRCVVSGCWPRLELWSPSNPLPPSAPTERHAMLTPQHHTNLRNACEYFEQHLAVGDYYNEQQAVLGEWIGKGADRLGLSGVVRKEDFVALCENRNPLTGDKPTVRTRTTRIATTADGEQTQVANRRLFYDFTISPPKSVSVAALAAGDERIVEAHDRAARLAMRELERFASTRVRRSGQSDDRSTGNVITAVFRHDTSRSLDPHLHSHCIVFNATFNHTEDRWKALQALDMFYARKYVENVYYHELARDLLRFGYRIVNNARGDFELEGMPHSLVRKFSKRDAQIDQQLRELLAKNPELAAGNVAEIRRHLAHSKRARKSPDVGLARLQEWWDTQMNDDDRQVLERLAEHGPVATAGAATQREEAALRWAEEHLFDRKSLVREHELWRFALERGRGDSFTVEELHAATKRADYIRDAARPDRLSTREVLQREVALIHTAQEGASACELLLAEWHGNEALDSEQAEAARHILTVEDFIILFRGGAGTGKSFTLKAVYDALREDGHTVQVLAPQRQQVEGLTLDGMAGAQTVSECLARQGLPRESVVIVDEAGQIGARDMLALLTLVKERGGRIVLSGDTRQHGPVQASDALWALEKYGRLHTAELNEIRRQDPERGRDEAERQRIAEYKKAVREASQGYIGDSFDRLNATGAIVECKSGNHQQVLTEHYLELARAGHTTLVVSPTWSEIHRVNDSVRQGLQEQGLIGGEEWQVTSWQADDLTDAQKRDTRFYADDRVVVFNQTARGVPKGTVGSLVAEVDEGVVVEAAGRIRTIPNRQVNRLTVCKTETMALSRGDRLQLKANAKTAAGESLTNGELVTVRRVDRRGDVHLDDGRILPPEYRQFVRDYAVTSYASQGKTVDHVLFSDSSVKAATNDRQWYVTISRARRGVKIFTPDKAALRENVIRSGQHELALDIAADGIVVGQTGEHAKPLPAAEFREQCRLQQQRHEAVQEWQKQQLNQTSSRHAQVKPKE